MYKIQYKITFISITLLLPLLIIFLYQRDLYFDQSVQVAEEKIVSDYLTLNKIKPEKPSSLLESYKRKSESPSINIDKVEKHWNDTSIIPSEWGEKVTGVMNRMDTHDNVIALTFDACGGANGNGYDQQLIDFLRKNSIPATLFINARWIQKNEDIFLELSSDELFSIQNHGTAHLPLSIQGKSAWGIQGTSSVDEVIQEVVGNQQLIGSLTGKYPVFFRSGTAFYDEVAVEIVKDLGLTPVNYDILGDAGATYSSTQVKNALLTAEPGSIALLHMNHPNSGTASGVMDAIPELLDQGFSFVKLEEYSLIE